MDVGLTGLLGGGGGGSLRHDTVITQRGTSASAISVSRQLRQRGLRKKNTMGAGGWALGLRNNCGDFCYSPISAFSYLGTFRSNATGIQNQKKRGSLDFVL